MVICLVGACSRGSTKPRAYAAQCCDSPRMVTKHISSVTFEKPVRPGQIIKIYGEVKKVGNSSITIRLEARRHSVYNGTQRIMSAQLIWFSFELTVMGKQFH